MSSRGLEHLRQTNRPHAIERIESTEQVVDLLKDATRTATPVVPMGGGNSLDTGNAVDMSGMTGLDLRSLSGIISYEPSDLTLSVRAGTTMTEIAEALGAHGQELPIDVPNLDTTTIGGLVATGFAGPRRLRSGTLRDLLIGCSYVRGDGMAASAGGLVVKNVSGFEIPRFLHSSWGSLAVITSVNLKIMPSSRSEATVVSDSLPLAHALRVARETVARFPLVESVVVESDRESGVVKVRVCGRTGAVQDHINEIAMGSSTVLKDDESIAHWQSLTDRFSEPVNELLVATTCALDSFERKTLDLAAQAKAENLDIRLLVSPGSSSIRLAMPTIEDDQEGVAALLKWTGRDGARSVMEVIPETLKPSFAVWGPENPSFAVMRDIKQQFDPAGILNPGRLFI